MSGTAECLKKTYIMMQSALGTEASLEIGARGAEYSLEMANTYGGAISLCAIEASPRTHAYFSKKINYRNWGISYIHALVSDRDEDTVFYEYVCEDMEPAFGLSSMLIRDIRQHGAVRRARSTVKAIRGDTFIESKFRNKQRIALWIDVEGAQYEVLHSLSKSFSLGIINSVYIEVEMKKLWIDQKMLDNDVIAFMNKQNFSQFLRDNEDDTQYNIIFVNNNITDCDFSLYFDHYRMLLQKIHIQ
jgi:FkbM family methyltransferase